MGTLKQEFIYFNDLVGRVIPNAELYFYDAGTTTPKDTYTSKALLNENPWPLVADSAGRFPVAWLENSAYRVIVKDNNGVTIEDRDDINTVEAFLNATSSIYFEDEADLALLIAQNGQTVNPSLNDALVTTGSANATDGEGADWVVVPAMTGTPGTDYINLANGLQAQRVDPYLRTSNNLQEIEDAGSSAQAEARDNIDVYSRDEVTEAISDAIGTKLLVFDGPSSSDVDLTSDTIQGSYPGDGLYYVKLSNAGAALVYVYSGEQSYAITSIAPETTGSDSRIRWYYIHVFGTTLRGRYQEIYSNGATLGNSGSSIILDNTTTRVITDVWKIIDDS